MRGKIDHVVLSKPRPLDRGFTGILLQMDIAYRSSKLGGDRFELVRCLGQPRQSAKHTAVDLQALPEFRIRTRGNGDFLFRVRLVLRIENRVAKPDQWLCSLPFTPKYPQGLEARHRGQHAHSMAL